MTTPQQLATAIRLAAAAHRDQVDKNGEPYILHPLRVMMACEGDARIVAVLHDVVEDTTVTLATIEQLFGTAIAQGVDAMTKRTDESYDDFIDRCIADPLARIVKRADIADNMNRERLDALDADTRTRLIDKYQRALDRMDRDAVQSYVRDLTAAAQSVECAS